MTQRQAWAFEPPSDNRDWVLHTRGDELWDDVVEILHTFEPSFVTVPALETSQAVALSARHMKQMIEEAGVVGSIMVAVPIVGMTRAVQREFFAWVDGTTGYVPQLLPPPFTSLEHVKVDLRPGGHYAVRAPESFTANNLKGTWEVFIDDPSRAVQGLPPSS